MQLLFRQMSISTFVYQVDGETTVPELPPAKMYPRATLFLWEEQFLIEDAPGTKQTAGCQARKPTAGASIIVNRMVPDSQSSHSTNIPRNHPDVGNYVGHRIGVPGRGRG